MGELFDLEKSVSRELETEQRFFELDVLEGIVVRLFII